MKLHFFPFQQRHLTEPDEELRRSVEEEICHRHIQTLDRNWDTFEIGYPEKLHSMLQHGWGIQTIGRFGKIPTQSAADDKELTRMISGVEGKNAIVFSKISKPKFVVQWNEMKVDSQFCLSGNSVWEQGFQMYLEEVEKSSDDSTVGASIYNPMNFVLALYQLPILNDSRYFPQLEVVVNRDDEERTEVLLGEIVWDGSTCPTSVDQCFGSPNIEEYTLAAHMGCQADLDAELLTAHGLSYSLGIVDEWQSELRRRAFPPTADRLVLAGEVSGTEVKTIGELIDANQEYFKSVAFRLNASMASF